MTRQVLFLCTGNYFRSRFAEALFDCRAVARAIPWTAASRGVAIELASDNIGPISHHTLRGFERWSIARPAAERFPIQLDEADLLQAHRIVALKEAEHRPIIARKFPAWTDRIEYWHIHDIDFADPDDTLAAIDQHVSALIDHLYTAAR